MTTVAGIQRPLRGSRISTFYPVKTLPSLSSLDSAFQLQEYISLLIRLDVHDVEAITSLPRSGSGFVDKEKEKPEVKEEEGEGDKESEKKGEVTVDQACWVFEHLRRLAQDLSHPLITTLQQECTRASCPEMKAGEWLYLCVAHGNDGAMEQCCAIDYILHTVDSATALLNSPKTFPSRLQIPHTSHRHFSSLARRLGRIFAHAYFHHREAFEQAEAESSLYARFLALTSKYDLVPSEFLVIPGGGTEDAGRDDGRYNQSQYPPLSQVRSGLAPKITQQQQLGHGSGPGGDTPNSNRARSPNPPGLQQDGFARGQGTVRMASGGIGEQPIPASMRGDSSSLGSSPSPPRESSPNPNKRIGRHRTDTMVLQPDPSEDRSKSGDNVEDEPMKTARPEPEVSAEKQSDSEASASDATPDPAASFSSSSTSEPTPEDTAADVAEEEEVASQFDISLTAEDEIASPFDTEIGGIPVILDAEDDDEEPVEEKDVTQAEEVPPPKEDEPEAKQPEEADVTDAPSSPVDADASDPSAVTDAPSEERSEPEIKITDFASVTSSETIATTEEDRPKTPETTPEESTSVAETPSESDPDVPVAHDEDPSKPVEKTEEVSEDKTEEKVEEKVEEKLEEKVDDVVEKPSNDSEPLATEEKKAIKEETLPSVEVSDP